MVGVASGEATAQYLPVQVAACKAVSNRIRLPAAPRSARSTTDVQLPPKQKAASSNLAGPADGARAA